MDQTENIVKMAGFSTAAALAWVSDGTPMPTQVALLGHDGKPRFFVMEEHGAHPSAAGGQKLPDFDDISAGKALIKDSLIALPSGKTDALIIDVAFSGPGKRCMQFAQPYRSAAHPQGFAVHRFKLMNIDGFAGTRDQVHAQAYRLSEFFVDGIKSHKDGSSLLNNDYVSNGGARDVNPGQEVTQLAEAEFQTLLRSPLLIFFLVAAADGRIDKKELSAFRKLLFNGEKYQNLLFLRIATNIISNLPALIEQQARRLSHILEDLLEIRRVVDCRMPQEQGVAFKRTLLALGWDIASSTGGLFRLYKKISKEEKATLAGIAQCLDVQTD